MDAKKYAAKSFVNVEYVEKHGPIEGTIEHVVLGQFDKLVITLGTGHQFSLNKTNVGILCRDFGEDTDDWLGQPVRLVVGEVKYKGAPTEAVVVEPLIDNEGEEAKPAPIEKPKKPAKSQAPKSVQPDPSDEIPF